MNQPHLGIALGAFATAIGRGFLVFGAGTATADQNQISGWSRIFSFLGSQ